MDDRDDILWREDEGWWDRTRTWWDSLPSKTRKQIVGGSLAAATVVFRLTMFDLVMQDERPQPVVDSRTSSTTSISP